MFASDKSRALALVRRILAADCACEEECFEKDGVFFRIAEKREGSRRFHVGEKVLSVTTMGAGEVVTCSPERLEWASRALGSFGSNQLFFAPALSRMNNYVSADGQYMMGPDLKSICARDSFVRVPPPKSVEIGLTGADRLAPLYSGNLFPNALGYFPDTNRPLRLVCIAVHSGVTVGVAAAVADADLMWQIGVDVLPEYRRHGIGKAIVSLLTAAVLERGVVPYYSASMANIASRSLAASVGFRPAWVEVYARNRSGPAPF